MKESKKALPLLLLQLLKVPASLLLLLVDRLKAGKQSLQQAENSLEHIHLKFDSYLQIPFVLRPTCRMFMMKVRLAEAYFHRTSNPWLKR